jgi:putative FmdB family regulatory protein
VPLYEYECKGCEGRFEVLVRTATSDARPACPDCGATEVRKLLSVVARTARSTAPTAVSDTARPSFGGGCCGGACGCGH